MHRGSSRDLFPMFILFAVLSVSWIAVLCLTLIWRKFSCHFSYLLCFSLSAHVGTYDVRVTPSSTALGPSILGSSQLVSACFLGSEASAGDSSGTDFLPRPCPSRHSSFLAQCFWSPELLLESFSGFPPACLHRPSVPACCLLYLGQPQHVNQGGFKLLR